MIVVSNTTPISELAKVGRLPLLQSVYSRILIPEEVRVELLDCTDPAVGAAPGLDWVEVRPVSRWERVSTLSFTTGLDRGESAAIVLAEEVAADWLILDDLAARKEAHARGLPVVGTIGLLLVAKREGVIDELRPILDDLIAHGTWIAEHLYRQALAAAGE